MTIQWLASKRIEGDDTEKDSLPINFLENGYSFTAIDTAKEYVWVDPDWVEIGGVAPAVGGWKEIGRTTLVGSGETISVDSLANKRYYMILSNLLPTGGAVRGDVRLNNDSANNYSDRQSDNGNTDGTDVNQNAMKKILISDSNPIFGAHYLANLSTKEKLLQGHATAQSTAGAGTPPTRTESMGKWANTSSMVNRYDVVEAGLAGTFDIGSEVVVLGWDPTDDNTDGFWEELASATETTGDTLSSGAFNPKKYLWVQAWVKYTGAGGTLEETFNTDVSASYASRDSYNGGADGESPSANNIDWDRGVTDNYYFINQFIINNSANEKLCIGHQNRVGTVGVGVAPDRSERVDKWANTSSQITQIDFNNTIVGVDIANAVLKVWGSD